MSSPEPNSGKTPSHLTGCLIVKPSGIDEIIVSPARRSVTIKSDVEANEGTSIPGKSDPFSFNSRLFVNHDEFTSGAYQSLVGPLVKKSCAGENTTAVIGGPGSLDFSNYLLSSNKSKGLLAQAANQMLNSIIVEGKREGTVTFSWYKLDSTGNDDNVDDILRSASEAGMPQGEKTKGMDMKLKELERGRGVTVPGLWEVELSTSSDVDAVITHVQRISNTAKHESGTSHSIIQLTVTSEHIRNSSAAFAQVGQGHAELKGVGKITFIALGNLKPRSFAGEDWDKQAFNPWVDDILTTIQWIESKEVGEGHTGPLPVNPKKSNYTSMALKDLLRGRQSSMMLTMLVPTKVLVNESRQWLLLGEAIENTRDECIRSGVATSPVPNRESRFQSPAPQRPAMTPGQFNGSKMNTPHALLPPPPQSPKEHHEFVEGGQGYEVLNTAREEIRALNDALRIKNEMLEEAQSAYNMLVTQLQEDGSTLKQKDRERYRQVLTELKDYEIYKNVMEAALTKMQNEMEVLLGENHQLKTKLSQKESDVRRKELFKDQYSKDLTATRKQLTEALEKVDDQADKFKKMQKEGEAIRLNSASLKTDRTQLKRDMEAKEAQLATLRAKVMSLEEKESVRSREEARLRESHKATLESCMGYQEENELLKAALAEMLEDASKSAAAGAGSPRKGSMSPRSMSPRRDSDGAFLKRSPPKAPAGEPPAGVLKKPGDKSKMGFRGSVVFQREKDERDERARQEAEQAERERKITASSVLFKEDGEEDTDEDGDGVGELSQINSRKQAKVAARHRASILA